MALIDKSARCGYVAKRLVAAVDRALGQGDAPVSRVSSASSAIRTETGTDRSLRGYLREWRVMRPKRALVRDADKSSTGR